MRSEPAQIEDALLALCFRPSAQKMPRFLGTWEALCFQSGSLHPLSVLLIALCLCLLARQAGRLIARPCGNVGLGSSKDALCDHRSDSADLLQSCEHVPAPPREA